MINSPPPSTERRPIHQSQIPYSINNQGEQRIFEDSEFARKVKNPPKSSSNKLVIPWDILQERYDISRFDPEQYYNKLSRNDIVETCRALHSQSDFQSHENKSNCLDVKTLIGIALFLILSLLFMIIGGSFMYISLALILLGIVILALRILYNISQNKNYHKNREEKYKEIARNLNTGRFIDKPFTVSIGDLAAWLEFTVSFVENDKPNRRLNHYYSDGMMMNSHQNMPNSNIFHDNYSSNTNRNDLYAYKNNLQNNGLTPSPIRIEDIENNQNYGNVSNFNHNPSGNNYKHSNGISTPGDVRIYQRGEENPKKRTFTTFGEASFGKQYQYNQNPQTRYPSSRLVENPQMVKRIKKPALKPDFGSIESDTFEATTMNRKVEKVTYVGRNLSSNQSKKQTNRVVYRSPNKENIPQNYQLTPKRLQYTPEKYGNNANVRRLTPQKQRTLTPTKRLPAIVRYVSNSPIRKNGN